jgi:hypothetical protein
LSHFVRFVCARSLCRFLRRRVNFDAWAWAFASHTTEVLQVNYTAVLKRDV